MSGEEDPSLAAPAPGALARLTELESAMRRVEATLDTHARRLGLTGPQRRALALVARLQALDGATVKSFAAGMVTDKTTASQMLHRLVRAGWLELAPYPGDRRRALFHLTASGRLALDRLEAAYASHLAHLGRDDFAALLGTAQRLAEVR